jgi:hypothetical protein
LTRIRTVETYNQLFHETPFSNWFASVPAALPERTAPGALDTLLPIRPAAKRRPPDAAVS